MRGFTLIEIMVAVAIFSIVMLIAIGAVFNAVDANRTAQNINVVINNLNLSTEIMVREMRTGRRYQSCGSTCIEFRDKNNIPVRYNLETITVNSVPKRVLRKASTPAQFGDGIVSSEQVDIQKFEFTIRGSNRGDGPERMLLHLSGTAGTGDNESVFNIQTLITSRNLDTNELN